MTIPNLFRVEQLRGRAKRLLREHRALSILLFQATEKYMKRYAQQEQRIAAMGQRELKALVAEIEGELAGIRRRVGASCSSQELLDFLERLERMPAGTALFIRKSDMRAYIEHYERVCPLFADIPEHAQIEVNAHIAVPANRPFEVFVLEAKLFEDMCALFNLAKTHVLKADGTKKAMKTAGALQRATVSATYYFVEAYLNGLAFDHCVTHQATLDEKTACLLKEYDSTKRRPRHLTLREKLKEYPRIASGAVHPPLMENNCPEMAYLLGRTKAIRDAVAHPSPLDTNPLGKEHEWLNPSFDEMEKTVDNAIALVRRIEKTIHGHERRLHWIRQREQDGLFADDAFL